MNCATRCASRSPRQSVKPYASSPTPFPHGSAPGRAGPVRICTVSFADVRGIRHTVEVQAESLFEAAILGVRTFRSDPWIEHVGPVTVLDIEVREPAAKHAITMMQVERWLEGASASPNEGVKKAKLKDLLGSH